MRPNRVHSVPPSGHRRGRDQHHLLSASATLCATDWPDTDVDRPIDWRRCRSRSAAIGPAIAARWSRARTSAPMNAAARLLHHRTSPGDDLDRRGTRRRPQPGHSSARLECRTDGLDHRPAGATVGAREHRHAFAAPARRVRTTVARARSEAACSGDASGRAIDRATVHRISGLLFRCAREARDRAGVAQPAFFALIVERRFRFSSKCPDVLEADAMPAREVVRSRTAARQNADCRYAVAAPRVAQRLLIAEAGRQRVHREEDRQRCRKSATPSARDGSASCRRPDMLAMVGALIAGAGLAHLVLECSASTNAMSARRPRRPPQWRCRTTALEAVAAALNRCAAIAKSPARARRPATHRPHVLHRDHARRCGRGQAALLRNSHGPRSGSALTPTRGLAYRRLWCTFRQAARSRCPWHRAIATLARSTSPPPRQRARDHVGAGGDAGVRGSCREWDAAAAGLVATASKTRNTAPPASPNVMFEHAGRRRRTRRALRFLPKTWICHGCTAFAVGGCRRCGDGTATAALHRRHPRALRTACFRPPPSARRPCSP